MKLASLHYQLADDQMLDQLLSHTKAVRFEHVSETQQQRCYLDSFDWRLYQNKSCLYTETSGQNTQLYWATLRDETNAQNCTITQPPIFADDLPASWQHDLAGVLEMRALQEKISLNMRVLEYRCLNHYDKTILRVFVTYYQPTIALSKSRLPVSLSIVPIRGYRKAYELIKKRMATLDASPKTQQNLLKPSLKLAGIKANDYNAKFNLKLSKKLNTAAACRVILGDLRHSLELNYAGTCADIDSEFLHDFRVAGRRSRALLSQIKGAFAPEQVQFLKTELAWLSKITSPTRDADVYLLKFANYQQDVPTAMQDHLTPFKAFLVQHQKTAQQILKHALESARYQTLMRDWQSFLTDEHVPSSEVAPNAQVPILSLANDRIWKAAQRLLKEGLLITPASPADALHDLRKLAKKLRYLLEFFQSLYDEAVLKPLVKNLKVLQDNLGDFQDFEVQAEQIQSFAQQMQGQYQANASTLMAMGALSATLLEGQAQMREKFADCFQVFANDKALYRQLCKASKEKEAVA